MVAMTSAQKRTAFYTDASLGIKDDDSRIPAQKFPLTSRSLFCAVTTEALPKLPWPQRGQKHPFFSIHDARKSC